MQNKAALKHTGGTTLPQRLRYYVITFNISYLMSFFMLLLAMAMELAPNDPLVRYMRVVGDYSPIVVKYTLIVSAALMFVFAPRRHPLNTLFAWPLASLYIAAARGITEGNIIYETFSTPWVSVALLYLSIIFVFLMLAGNFVFVALYRQVEECETERLVKANEPTT